MRETQPPIASISSRTSFFNSGGASTFALLPRLNTQRTTFLQPADVEAYLDPNSRIVQDL